MQTCRSEHELRQLLAGGLPADAAGELAAHLDDCPRCAALVDLMDARDSIASLLRGQTTGALPAVQPLVEKVKQLRNPAEAVTRGLDGEPPSTLSPAAPVAADGQQHTQRDLGMMGPFKLLRQLGQGGMGVVFEAEDTALARKVALKVVKREFAADPEYRSRFFREARSAAAITHDHIVSVYVVGEHEGMPYLAMPLLKGSSLQTWLDKRKPLTIGQAVRIAREASKGLAAAHQAGLVHRDLKPANLWLEAPNGRVKLLDFGLARSSKNDNLTASGLILGTPGYMSPEQARGNPVDQKTDLFALGVLLYQLLTGKLPFTGNDAVSKLVSAMVDDPDKIQTLNPEVPDELSDLVEQLLAKDPAQRPESAQQVTERLLGIERRLRVSADSYAVPVPHQTPTVDPGFSVVTEVVPPPRSGVKRRRKKKPAIPAWVGAALGAAGVLTAIAVAVLIYQVARRATPPPPTQPAAPKLGKLLMSAGEPPLGVTILQNGKVVSTVHAGTTGTEVELPPGDYVLQPEHPDTEAIGFPGGKVTIVAGERVSVLLRPRGFGPPGAFDSNGPPPQPEKKDPRPKGPWPPDGKGPPPDGKGPPPDGKGPRPFPPPDGKGPPEQIQPPRPPLGALQNLPTVQPW